MLKHIVISYVAKVCIKQMDKAFLLWSKTEDKAVCLVEI